MVSDGIIYATSINKISIGGLNTMSELINKIIERNKVRKIGKIVQKTGMTYSSGKFYFGGGLAMLDLRTEEQKQKDWKEKTKSWSQYRKEHGYEKGSYMDIINKKFGGVKGIWVSQNHIGSKANIAVTI